MKNFDPERRNLLKNAGLAGAGLIGSGLALSSIAKAAAAIKTPAQTEGPFYPVRDQLDKDADLTRVQGRAESAEGTEVLLKGRLFDADTGLPITGALVEFWQACASGKYNHPEDPNTAPLDQNFQYWAQVHTGNQGEFSIRTIKPGAYPATANWIRPPHIHVKVHKAGYPSLTTQIYFKGDQYNNTDQILQKLTPAQQNLVTVDFTTQPDTNELSGNWNIYLGKFQGITASGADRLTTPELD